MPRTLSPEAKAKRRNANAAKRFPLLAHAGLLDQIGVKADWDAQSVQDSDFAGAIERDVSRQCWEQRERKLYAIFVTMLDEAITQENREEVLADYEERIRAGTFASEHMQEWSTRIDYLNGYLATYLRRPRLAIYEEAKRRMECV